jgi:hypothetical protein
MEFPSDTKQAAPLEESGPFNLPLKSLKIIFKEISTFKELSIVLLSGIAGLSLLFTLGA